MTEIENVSENRLDHQINLCRELLNLCHEQRATIKSRDLEKFQGTTETLTKKYEDFHNSYIDLNQEVLSDEAGLKKLWKELNDLLQELKRENQINMLLINNSLQVMRQVIKIFQPDNSLTYEDKGNIKLDSLTANALNKTV